MNFSHIGVELFQEKQDLIIQSIYYKSVCREALTSTRSSKYITFKKEPSFALKFAESKKNTRSLDIHKKYVFVGLLGLMFRLSMLI